MTILDEIFAHKQLEVAERKARCSLPEMRKMALDTPAPLDFTGALRSDPNKPAVIAEIKRGSPSRGMMAAGLVAADTARVYRAAGAAAVSVLTDHKYFGGSLQDLRDARLAAPDLPLLRKEFICDAYQIYESRANGADAVLLIAAHLSDAQLTEFHSLSGELGLAALVETHNRAELERTLRMKPALVGINNRDLHTFQVSLETTHELRPLVPAGVCLVAESGIHTVEDVALLKELNVDAMLIGEALVTSGDPGETLRRLRCA